MPCYKKLSRARALMSPPTPIFHVHFVSFEFDFSLVIKYTDDKLSRTGLFWHRVQWLVSGPRLVSGLSCLWSVALGSIGWG